MSYAHTLSGSTLGADWAGFSAKDVSDYLGISYADAAAMIRIGSGGRAPDDLLVVQKFKNQRWKTPARYSGAMNKWDDIRWGLQHLMEHPAGSHYHGGIGNLVKNIGLNIATGGLYQVAKSGIAVAQGGKVIPNVTKAVASWGTGGGVLTPIVGTNKSLAIQGAVAAAALSAAAAAGALTGGAKLIPTAAKIAAPLITGPGAPAPSAPVPSGLDPRYNPGYSDPTLGPGSAADAGYGPNLDPTTGRPIEAGMFSGLSPVVLLGLIGIPLAFQYFFRGRK